MPFLRTSTFAASDEAPAASTGPIAAARAARCCATSALPAASGARTAAIPTGQGRRAWRWVRAGGRSARSPARGTRRGRRA